MQTTFLHTATALYSSALKRIRKRLRREIDQLAQGTDAQFIQGWDGLVAATEAAFRHEEALMELHGEARMGEYRVVTAHMLAALHHLTTQVEMGDTALARKALAALSLIVSYHRILPQPRPRRLLPFRRPATVPAATQARA